MANDDDNDRKQDELDEQIRDRMEGNNFTPQIRIEVYRLEPESWNGRKLTGLLGHYDELADDLWMDIRDEHGGGKFKLVIKRADKSGKLVYAKSGTLQIAGNPLVPADAPLALTREQQDELFELVARLVDERVEDRLRALEVGLDLRAANR